MFPGNLEISLFHKVLNFNYFALIPTDIVILEKDTISEWDLTVTQKYIEYDKIKI